MLHPILPCLTLLTVSSCVPTGIVRAIAAGNPGCVYEHFFLISSNVPGNDTLVKRLVREGHEIGNHFSENEASIALSPRDFERSFLTAARPGAR